MLRFLNQPSFVKPIEAHRPESAISRRLFLQSTLGVTATLASGSNGVSASGQSFSFVLLGDLHFDRLEHHDFGWLDKHHPVTCRRFGITQS